MILPGEGTKVVEEIGKKLFEENIVGRGLVGGNGNLNKTSFNRMKNEH